MDILTHDGFDCILSKSKLHPKDTYKSDPCNFGRIHLLFKHTDGSPIRPDIAKTKTQLLKHLGSKIPELKSRVQNPNPKPAPDAKKPKGAVAGSSKSIEQDRKSSPAPQPKAAGGAKRKPRKKRK